MQHKCRVGGWLVGRGWVVKKRVKAAFHMLQTLVLVEAPSLFVGGSGLRVLFVIAPNTNTYNKQYTKNIPNTSTYTKNVHTKSIPNPPRRAGRGGPTAA